MLFGLSILGSLRYGDYITKECPQGGYACPSVCDVDHKHYPRKECKNATRTRNIWKAGWKTIEEKESKKEKIEEYKNAETEQESRSDTTTVQSFQ